MFNFESFETARPEMILKFLSTSGVNLTTILLNILHRTKL